MQHKVGIEQVRPALALFGRFLPRPRPRRASVAVFFMVRDAVEFRSARFYSAASGSGVNRAGGISISRATSAVKSSASSRKPSDFSKVRSFI